jgi:D-alanine-D-alanine ligase
MRIAVLAGADSPERDVSLTSGSAVAFALAAQGHEVTITDPGEREGPLGAFTRGGADDEVIPVPEEPPSEADLAERRECTSERFSNPAFQAGLQASDVVFLALHGGHGEDGHVQAILDRLSCTYTGTGSRGSALAWNKHLAKRLMADAGVPVLPGVVVGGSDEVPDDSRDAGDYAELEAAAGFDPGFVIKPTSGGSSIGVHQAADLPAALSLARSMSEAALIEPFVGGREFTVGVVGRRVLPVVEIVAGESLWGYASKYQPGAVRELCPAPLGAAETERLQSFAALAHDALEIGTDAYSRVDFRSDRRGNMYCLEVNTLPGLTPQSLLPLAAKTDGILFPMLCDEIVRLALEKGPAPRVGRTPAP